MLRSLITSYVLLIFSGLLVTYRIGLQVNETELEVSSDSASYKQRLEVLQQQEELIEDEEEQEAKESEARRIKKEEDEEAKVEAERLELAEKEIADALLPEAEVRTLHVRRPTPHSRDAPCRPLLRRRRCHQSRRLPTPPMCA